MPIFGTGMEIGGESIILIGIGFLLAGLVEIACFPLVHNRAVRLTMRRIEATTPTSLREMQADKDHLRAEFAVSARRLETSIEDLRNKSLAQKATLGEKTSLIQRLKTELEERAARIFALEAREAELEAREKSLFDQLRASKDDVTRMSDALRAAESAAAHMKTEQGMFESAMAERTRLVEDQRIEIVALQSQIDTIRRQVYDMASSLKEGETRLAREWREFKNAETARGNGGPNDAHTGAGVESISPYKNGSIGATLVQARNPISS